MAKIKDIRTIRTRAEGAWLFVKVITDQDGLYGIGSASDAYRCRAVETAVETIKPLLIGREVSRIEDIWHAVHTCSYWRNEAVGNTVQAGIDMALWDIKGKVAGLPVYELLGGACRDAVMCYAHASGDSHEKLEASVRKYLEEGYHVVRCQLGPYGGGGFLKASEAGVPGTHRGGASVFDDEAYLEAVPRMFEYLRDKLGAGPKLTHDVHEHLHPHNAVLLAKRLEPFNLFFLEDLLPPEQLGWYRNVRALCATPQAVGELFTNPQEYLPLISERLIDYIRLRVSKSGGITACRKVAALCEWFGVRTAWQEGGDSDPVNQMAAVQLDMAIRSFGIQEENTFRPEEYDAFPGHAVLKGGYLHPGNRPGLGIDIDEDLARKLLDPALAAQSYFMPEDRRRDGEIVRP